MSQSLTEQIEKVWTSNDYPKSPLQGTQGHGPKSPPQETQGHRPKPNIVLTTDQEGDPYVVISETSTVFRTLDRYGHVYIISKPESNTTSDSVNIEISPTECRYMTEYDDFVMNSIHPLVFPRGV